MKYSTQYIIVSNPDITTAGLILQAFLRRRRRGFKAMSNFIFMFVVLLILHSQQKEIFLKKISNLKGITRI